MTRSVLIFALLVAPGMAWAQEDEMPLPERPKIEAAIKNPLKVRLDGPTLNSRSGAPIPLKWTITWKGKGVLEGKLQYQLSDEGRVIGTFVIEDLAISGEQSFRVMLPVVRNPTDLDAVDVRATFIAADKTWELEPQSVKIPLLSSRHVMLALCDVTDVSLSPEAAQLLDGLKLTQFEADPRNLVTQNLRFRAQDMPSDPLMHCGSDVLAITGQSFGELKEPQLAAIRQWVEAGGAVYVAPAGGLQTWHLKFLNELASETFPSQPFQIDKARLLQGGPADQKWHAVRHGLGRAAINRSLEAPKLDEPSSPLRPEWRELAGFLWRVRRDQLAAIREGAWDETRAATPQAQSDPASVNFTNQGQFASNSSQSGERAKSRHYPRYAKVGDWLLKNLLPERVQVVPLWLLAAVLGAYVLLIGPAEYLGLGVVRLRRLTWITFPLATLAFTAGIVWISNRYMFSEVQSRAVTFVDVVGEGRVVRQNRIELLFTNTYRELKHDVQRGYFTPLRLQAFGARLPSEQSEDTFRPGDDFEQFGLDHRQQGSAAETVTYVGRVPGRYVAAQNVPQWTPHLNRLMQVAPDVSPVDFPWTQFSPADFSSNAGVGKLQKAITGRFGPGASAWLYHGVAPRDPAKPRTYADLATLVVAGQGAGPLNEPFLAALCIGGEDGLPRYVARQSPAGGGNFEDLPLLDPSDPDEWLLVIFVPQGDDYVAYRRLYR